MTTEQPRVLPEQPPKPPQKSSASTKIYEICPVNNCTVATVFAQLGRRSRYLADSEALRRAQANGRRCWAGCSFTRGTKSAAPSVQTLPWVMLSGEVPLLYAWQLGWEPGCLGPPETPQKGPPPQTSGLKV